MSELYPYILIVHLLCAIFFIGYLFVDVLILTLIKKKYPNFDKQLFNSGGVKIMPFIVLLLFLSGGALASFHFNPLNLLFVLKMVLAFGILALVLFSLFFHFVLKKPNPLGKFIHPLVFVVCIFVVFLAKLMNFVFIAF
ncbi:copper resistance protein CopD [Campylobacter cuniculorum]|uniref:copper resistance protein CopD n=1 Tax=Campylobacter cuniculorum TaxID=374106 RepID=UPI0023F363F6|nr:copper resistance protein CopD [Campylobacter cuniculorum]